MRWLLLLSVVSLTACGGKPSDEPEAMTIDGWRTLPVEQKYLPETFERLRSDNPTLETDEGWRAFERSTLLPSRQEDFQKR